MSADTFFTTNEVAQQLNVGVSTVKVWSKRYSKWLPATINNNELVFTQKTLETFQLISECTSSGMKAESIETVLDESLENLNSDSNSDIDAAKPESEETNRAKTSNSIFENLTKSGIDDILVEILNQQKKIASAQDRRATAEERKAFALESRAEAELLKANVMQEMLTVLKEQPSQQSVSSLMNRIHEMPGPSPSELDFEFDDQLENLPELTESTPQESQHQDQPKTEISEEPSPASSPEMEELIVPEPPAPEENDVQIQQENNDDQSQTPDVQDSTVEDIPEDIDDLSLLIDNDQSEPLDDIDDLSLLIDNVGTEEVSLSNDLDDLSALIDKTDDDIDDLSLLIGEPAQQLSEDIDDLSLLIEDVPATQQSSEDATTEDMDDLSLLIDGPAKPVEEKPPEKKEAEGNHKSQVLSKIIKLKEKEGLSIEETTQKLNDEGVKTLSGKGQWDTKTITGIYKYIDSGKEKK